MIKNIEPKDPTKATPTATSDAAVQRKTSGRIRWGGRKTGTLKAH